MQIDSKLNSKPYDYLYKNNLAGSLIKDSSTFLRVMHEDMMGDLPEWPLFEGGVP